MTRKLLASGLCCFSLFTALIFFKSCGNVQAATATITWNYDYTQDPNCTATKTTECVGGFDYGTTPDGGTTLNSLGTAPNPPNGISTTGPTNGISATFKIGPPYGNAIVGYIRPFGIDSNGGKIYGAPDLTAAVPIGPASATGAALSIH